MNMYRVLYAVRCEKGFAATGPILTFVALLGSCKLKIANHKYEICYFFNSVINNSRYTCDFLAFIEYYFKFSEVINGFWN